MRAGGGKWVVCAARCCSNRRVESNGVVKIAVLAAESGLCDRECEADYRRETRFGRLGQRIGDARGKNVVKCARIGPMGSELYHDALVRICGLCAFGRHGRI